MNNTIELEQSVNVTFSQRAAIRTKYMPATNCKPSRIKAWKENGISIIISYDDSLNSDMAHARAAMALCEKYGWKGNLVSGGFNDGGYCFVWVD
jgi:hypothetical protein